MKRLVIVLALALMLCFTLSVGSDARITPDNYVDPSLGGDGDDHPWGGDDTGGDGASTTKDYVDRFTTNLGPVDFIFELLMNQKFFYRSTQADYYKTQQLETQGSTINLGADSHQRNY